MNALSKSGCEISDKDTHTHTHTHTHRGKPLTYSLAPQCCYEHVLLRISTADDVDVGTLETGAMARLSALPPHPRHVTMLATCTKNAATGAEARFRSSFLVHLHQVARLADVNCSIPKSTMGCGWHSSAGPSRSISLAALLSSAWAKRMK